MQEQPPPQNVSDRRHRRASVALGACRPHLRTRGIALTQRIAARTRGARGAHQRCALASARGCTCVAVDGGFMTGRDDQQTWVAGGLIWARRTTTDIAASGGAWRPEPLEEPMRRDLSGRREDFTRSSGDRGVGREMVGARKLAAEDGRPTSTPLSRARVGQVSPVGAGLAIVAFRAHISPGEDASFLSAAI